MQYSMIVVELLHTTAGVHVLLLSVRLIIVAVPPGEVCETSYCVETDVLSWHRTAHAKATIWRTIVRIIVQ